MSFSDDLLEAERRVSDIHLQKQTHKCSIDADRFVDYKQVDRNCWLCGGERTDEWHHILPAQMYDDSYVREWAVVRVCKDCHAKIHSILNNERLRNYQSDDPKSDYQKDLKAVEDLHALIHLKKVVNRLRPGWLEE